MQNCQGLSVVCFRGPGQLEYNRYLREREKPSLLGSRHPRDQFIVMAMQAIPDVGQDLET